MIIRVDRFVSDADSTISRITVDNAFVCFGLEDEYRAEKVADETRIPGNHAYDVGVRKMGGFHARYAQRFEGMHKGMLQVLDVPGFEYILIHVGNTDKDTAGCLLVGDQAVTTPGAMSLVASVSAYRRFYPMVIDYALDEDLQIEYQDNDL